MGRKKHRKQKQFIGLWEESSHEKDGTAVLASSGVADGGIRK